MINHYRYEISGDAFGGQTWMTTGHVDCEFLEAYHACMKASFLQLTEGKAQFGKPGIGCHGPYLLNRILIEKVKP